MFTAKVVAHSECSETGKQIASVVVKLPRIVLSELNTHRAFSRNSASSRAIPFKKMVELVKTDPFIPIAFQKEHKGMQGTEYFKDEMIDKLQRNWLLARDFAVQEAETLSSFGVTKQLCNRILEPYMWHTVLITATEWDNFMDLRSPQYVNPYGESFRSRKDYILSNPDSEMQPTTDLGWLSINKGQAEIHMMAAAEAIYDALQESVPKQLKPKEWHIPFGDQIDEQRLWDFAQEIANYGEGHRFYRHHAQHVGELTVKIATARCARVSYLNYEGKDDYESDLKLYEALKESRHASPFEHCAIAMGTKHHDNYLNIRAGVTEVGWSRNFNGFIQYRELVGL